MKPTDLSARITALFASPAYQPLAERDLAKALQLKPGQRGALRQALRELEQKGQAAPRRGGRWGAPAAASNQILGTFRVRINGSCWLIPDDPRQPPMRIDPDSTGVAMNGDRVQVVPIRRETHSRMFGADSDTRIARVVRVLSRKRQWVVGILQATPYYAYVVPRDSLLRGNIKLTDSPQSLEDHIGNLIVTRIVEDEPSAGHPVTATFVEDLGDPDSVSNDIPALLRDHGYTNTFPEAVKKQVNRVKNQIQKSGVNTKGRTDLRGTLAMTIDPATAHDFDDAISLEALPGGTWKLGVHIADVAAYVQPGSDIDREAQRRGNSTYLVDRVIHMLPKDLTINVCSLQAGSDHLTHTVELVFDAKGNRLSASTFRSVIRPQANLSYDQVQAFFDTGKPGGLPPAVCDTLRNLRQLTRQMRAIRKREGALDFFLPEIECQLDAQGNPVGFIKREPNDATNLIEECMLAANRVVARRIHDAGVPGIYRVHDEPSEDQWARMTEELAALNHPENPSRSADLNRIARSVIGKPDQHIVTLTLLRNLKSAVYEAENRPHFGLGFQHYAHFTSPIRRYPDLILHRILNALEDGAKKPAYTEAEIKALAIHCSSTERESADLENQSLYIKRIRYYASLLARREVGPFDGTIVSLNPKGLIVELHDTLQQGMLAYHTLGRERYYVADDSLSATSRKGSAFRLGQPVRVILAAVDERLRRVDFALDAPPRAAARNSSRDASREPSARAAGRRGNSAASKARRSAPPKPAPAAANKKKQAHASKGVDKSGRKNANKRSRN